MHVDKLDQRSPQERQPILVLSWQTIHEAVDILAHMIKPYKPHLIVGIARGGLIPATMLSHKLNCPIETISASSYEGTRRTLSKPTQIEGWKEEYNTSNTIIVDDIMDTGETYDALLYGDGRLGTNFKPKLFCMVKKTEARFVNWKNYYIQVPQDVWVKFPWEQDET